LPPLPKKNKQSSTTSNLINGVMGRDEDDASSMSSVSTMGTVPVSGVVEQKLGNLKVRDHRRSASALSLGRESPRASTDSLRPKIGSTPGTPKPNGTGDVSTFPHSPKTHIILIVSSPSSSGAKTNASPSEHFSEHCSVIPR
jgi:hypothetical protein